MSPKSKIKRSDSVKVDEKKKPKRSQTLDKSNLSAVDFAKE